MRKNYGENGVYAFIFLLNSGKECTIICAMRQVNSFVTMCEITNNFFSPKLNYLHQDIMLLNVCIDYYQQNT